MEQFVDENNYPLFDGINGLKQERMSQTAMQEFFMVLKEFNKELYNTMYNEGILDTALEKEKEQIIEAFDKGIEFAYPTNGANYYNQKYNQNK